MPGSFYGVDLRRFTNLGIAPGKAGGTIHKEYDEQLDDGYFGSQTFAQAIVYG